MVRAKAQRQTWVPLAQADFDVRFFFGHCPSDSPFLGMDILEDEVLLDVPDDYDSLPAKVQAMYEWALKLGYEKVLKTDDDSYIVPGRLKEVCPVPPHDYVGNVRNATGGYPAPYSSGFGYWLSRRAMQLIVDEPLGKDLSEDRWVGNTLARHGVDPICDDYHYRWFSRGYSPNLIWNTAASVGHGAVYAEFSPERMRQVHAAFVKQYPNYVKKSRKPRPKLHGFTWR